MEKEEVRKGSWTEQEDVQLVFYVNLFGDRRWDFIAKVSGLKRTGKSCRLRWVNYLQPGLKRGKMTPHEERLVLELHARYGNRWSRIAQKLPGRTDNEIKNYWRIQMRKKDHQERKKAINISPSPSPSPSSSSSNSSYSSISNSPSAAELSQFTENNELGFYNTGGFDTLAASGDNKAGLEVESTKVYSMDEIWKDVEMSEKSSKSAIVHSPLLDFSPSTDHQSLWSSMGHDQEVLMLQMDDDHFLYSLPFCNYHPMNGYK